VCRKEGRGIRCTKRKKVGKRWSDSNERLGAADLQESVQEASTPAVRNVPLIRQKKAEYTVRRGEEIKRNRHKKDDFSEAS